MCEKLWKWKFFMHFLTFFYVSVLTSVSADYAIVISVSASVSADMKIRYIGGYRYRPIWKNAYLSPTIPACYLGRLFENPKFTSTFLNPKKYILIYNTLLIQVNKYLVLRFSKSFFTIKVVTLEAWNRKTFEFPYISNKSCEKKFEHSCFLFS